MSDELENAREPIRRAAGGDRSTLVAAVAGLIWTYTISGRVAHQEAALTIKPAECEACCPTARNQCAPHCATDELGKSLGLTQKQLDERAQSLIAREQATAAGLETAQKQTEQQVSAVASDVTNVKTD